MEDKLYKAWQSAGKYYDLPDYETFKEDMKDEGKLHRFHESLGKYYDVPDYDTFKNDMWGTAAQQQPTGQTGAAAAGQTTSAGEMVAQAAPPAGPQTPEQELQEFTRDVRQWNPQSPAGYAKGASGNYGPTRADDQGVYITPESQTPEEKAIQERISQVGEAYEDPDVYSFEPEAGDGKMHYSWRNGRRIGQLDPGALRFAHIGRNYSSDAYKQAEQAAAGMSDDQLREEFNKLYAAYSNSGDDALTQGYGRDDASRMMAYATEMRYRDVGMGHAKDYGGGGQQSQTGVYHYHAARMNPAVATEMDTQDKMGWDKRISYLSDVLRDKQARENVINTGVDTAEDRAALEDDRRKLLAGAMLYARDNHIYPEDAYRIVVGAANNATPKDSGFWAGFASTTSQMWRDVKYFIGEAANLVADDRGDILDAISALDKYGEDAETKLIAGTLHNMGLLGKLIFDGDEAGASEGAGRILAECIVKDKDGRIDVDATRAALLRKLQSTYSWGDRTMRDNIYNTAMAKQTEGNSAWWGQQMAQLMPTTAAIIVGVTTRNPAAAQAIGQLGMGYMCISSGSQAMQEARMYGANDDQVWTAGIVNAVLEYAFERVPFDRYTKRVFGEVKATSARKLMEAVADVNHPAHHEIQQLLESARKELGNGKLLKAYTGDVLAEGSSEAVTGMLQKASEILYKNPEDYPTFMEILDEGIESAKGGAAMGGVMGFVSTGTTSLQADNRRKKAGVVSVGIFEGEDGMGVPVEIIDHDRAGNYIVLDGQHNELIVAPGKLKGVTTYTYDEWKRGEVQYEEAQEQSRGYNAQGEEREEVQDDLQRAEQRLNELGYDMSSSDGWTSDAFEERIASGEHDYTDEDIEAIRDYFRAKAASDGIQQRVEDDIDTQVQQASDLVDKQTNQDTGMVHRAVLNEHHGSQEVYVTGGQLVMTGDGVMIDTEASDQSLFVYNPATGQPEQYTPSDFQSVDDPVNPEQLKSEAARDIRQAVEQQAEADMNGYVQQGGAYDMVDEQGNALHGTVLELRPDNTAVVQVDGEQMPLAVPTQQLQAWVDNAKQIRMSMEPAALPTRGNEGQATDADTGRVANATNETIEAPAVEPMVMDEQTGEPAWLQSTPERGYQYLVNESGLIGDDITSLIDDRIAQAEAAIEKSSKGGTIDQRLQARQAKDYWDGVKAVHEAAMAQPAATGTTALQSPTGQPTTTGQAAPAGTVRVEAGQAETMPVGDVPVNPDGTRAEDRGQLGIRREDTEYFLRTMSPRMMGMLDKVAKSLGWKIRLYNGENANERGHYMNGVVWVNRRAMTSKLAQWILGHEMTHGMAKRTGRGETFLSYVELANELKKNEWGDESYEKYVNDNIEAYKQHLRKNGYDSDVVDRAYIEEEIACDVTGDLLMNNPEMIGKLFSGVESPSKLKRIIDMIVDALDYLKSKLPWRSEEREAFDDLIKRLNNLYRDAKAQTDIAKATAREEGSQVESGEGERTGSSFSITGNAEGSGFAASETVMEVWRVPQEDGTYKEEEHWVKRPLLDSEGNVVFRMGGREYSGNNPITVDDLKSNPDTILNYMLQDALRAGTIDEMKADQVRQQYADMLNLYLEKGLAENGGFENLENNWLWVGETVFRTVASNSDEQYSYSMDITKVCKKNEAVIRAISAMQVKTGYGVTPAQILEIYETTDAEGFQVPCPVCYVFSRYINNGKYATAIVNGMKKYGKYLPGQAEAKPVEWWVKEFKDAQARAEKMKTPLKNANDDVKVILQQIDALCREITSGKLSAEEAESKRRHVRALDQRYRAALDVISQEALPRWIKAFVIEGSDQGGWSLREDAALPEDMDDFTLHALDIRKTASAMEKYPALTRYRRAGGSAGGKEITFASNNELGTIVMGLGISKDKLDDYPNYYQLAAEAATDEERQALLQKARERFDKARLYAQRQTLRGGQRMWSWSDNIESLSSDVASNLMQLELLGGALQTYSKQLEGVKMVAAMNGYVNASLMGYGDGIREVGPDEIENGRLKDDIWDVNNKGRRRIIANAGSPVYHNEADGKDYVLVFDDVVGIDPFGHDGKRGLFSLNEEYDRAGNILVGMNDIHVRAAMADPRVFFIIPWHASGMSNHILQQMFNILGVDMDKFVSTDYTKMQEETNYLLKKDDGSPKKKVPKEVEDFWDSHTFEDEFACGTGHIENGDRQGGLSESQLHYRSLRDAIFDGTAKDNEGMMKEILADEFLSQVYRQVTTRVDDGKMTEKDKEFIYPYEYWDETSTVENADVNGRRYVEYCRRMGFKPKFTGKFDDKTGYSPEGNFADDPGYWKLLIDRRMYDRRGNYQDLTPIDSSGLDSSMYDPAQTSEEFNVTEVATNEGAEKIADIVYQRDAERTGSMPAPNLDMTMDEAVSRYKEVTALQASLIKAEREALAAADVAKQKVEKANTLKAQDTDGRKAKSVARAQESARKAMEVAKQKAREVDEIAGQFGNAGNAGAHGTPRFSLSTEIAARYPNWMDNQVIDDEESKQGQRTQVKTTLATYKKLADWIDKHKGKDLSVLDASSGLGYGTEEFRARGFNIEDIEPYPSGKRMKENPPTYGGVDAYQRAMDDGKEYDFIISNAVLNVIPDDWRRGVLHDMATLLAPGGKMFINTRKKGGEKSIKNKIELESPYEVLVGTPDNITSYQRFFTPKELKEYVERELGEGFEVEIATPENSGTNGDNSLAAVVVTKTGDSTPRFSVEEGAKLAPQYQKATYEEMAGGLIPFNGKLRRGAESKFKVVDDAKKVFDNWYGTRQKRYKYNVGKEMGAGIYVHKDYAGDIVPADVLDKAKAIAEREGIEYKIVYYEPKKPNMVRLDEAPDFDTAREPIPGKWTWVDTETGELGKTGNSKQIWHNKWMWVKDDYKGFDVDEAYEWSKTWNQEISKPDGWSYKWDYLLDQAGLPKDWTGSALAAEEPTNPDGPGGGKSIDSVVAEAEQMTETNPTDGQKESGNYRKGHVKVDGFDISIEQPKGSVRSGVDADGKEWSQEMHNTYGYIRGTEGVDGDHIDVFLSDHLDGWNGNVYVVDQVNKDRSFDEHKVMYGFNSEQEAREAYLSNYEEGWTGLGNITGVSREEFKKWVDSSHRKNKPFAEYKNVKPLQSTEETGARFSLKDDEERTLMGMHNITAEKLRSALNLGGLANPSMAVINTEVGGFTNFGEISLIPSADLIASRTGGNAGTWGADAYSPRFPETHRRLGKGGDKKMRAWVKGLKMRQEMEYNTEEQFNDYYNGFNIRDNALVYPFLHEKGLSGDVDYYTHMNVDQRLEDDLREVNGDQWALLKRFDEDEAYKQKLTDIVVGDELKKINKKEGETFQEYRDRRREWAKEIRETLTEEDGYINRNLAEDLLYAQARAYKENGKFSESRTRDNAEQYIRDHGMEDEYKQYFEQKMQELGAETQVYAGSDSQGRSRYKPVSLDQVSKQMKRQGRAGGEGGIFADSPGAIRAKLLTPMKTLDQIRAKKDRIVSHEAFEQFRERYQEELREAADVYARGSMGALADIITSSNMASTAKRYNIDLDADAVAELNKFKNRVRALPTEYFETKFERPVMLDEFKKAIVPDDLPLDLQGALQRAGLEVVEYKHGDNADRERVTLDAVKDDDSIRFSLSLGAPYQGSKGQIATRVVDALPSGRRFVDLFAGGGAVTHAAMLSGKYGEYRVNDINPAGLELFLGGMRGDYRDYQPRKMTPEEFKAIKGTPEGLMLSYGGMGRNVDPDKDSVARRVRRVQRLEDLKLYAEQVESSNSDYRDVELEPGDVVYADIPYQGTNKTGYREGAKFDKKAFSDWALDQDVPIYVSEQSMPAGWVEVASWEMPSMNAQKKRGEKLFVQERFAGDGGRVDGRVNNATYNDNADARFSISPEEQERQTHSENFKNWFGDWENDPENASKVVDEEGKPLVVYHTNREGSGFYEFDTSVKRNRINMGSHFGTAIQAANIALDGESDGYKPKTYAVYLDIKNPLEVVDFFADDNAYWANLLVKLVNENNINDPKINDVIAKMKEKWPWIDGNDDSLWADDNYEQRNDSKYQFDDIPELYNALRDVAERLGYDGFVYENQIEGDGLSYVAFRPEQIKSATDNNGDFSQENPDIRFSLSQRERDYTANVLKKLRGAGVNVQLATDEEAQRVLDAADQVVTQLMRGWHGSHANFDAFDHSHMGEGEGAQAYGWGTYITEVEGIARKYASAKPDAATIIKVSNGQRTVRVMEDLVNGMKKDLDENTRNLQNTKKWIDEAKKELADIIKQYGQDSFEFSDWHRQRDMQMEAWQDDANSYKRAIKSIKGRLPKYEEKLEEARELLKKIEDELNRPGGRFLYEITIPENDGTNYLPYNGQLSEETTDKLINAIKENLDKIKRDKATYEAEISALRDPAQQKFGDDWLKSLSNEDHARFNDLIEKQYVAIQREAHLKSALIKADMGDEFRYIQDQLEMAFGAKETSEFLSDLGFVGIEYPAMFRSGGRKDDAKNYVIFNEDDAQIINKTEFLKTSDGTVYGWHDNDGIHLAAAGLNPNTPMHEYTHGLMAMLKEREPEKYQQIVEALKDSEVWQEVLNDELYSSIRDDVDAVASEVASRLSGRESERRANESMPARIKRAIQELWETVAEWFGVKSPMTTDSIARMTLRELERGTNPDGDGPGGGTNGGDGPRFSLSGDGTVDEYNRAVNMTGRTFNVGGREVKPGITRYNFQEAFQDSILAVKKLQQVVERHFGIKLPTRENAWMYENRLSSINMHERKSFYDKVYDPMMKIADRILKRGVKDKELNAYLICKHGLERNQVFAMRDANEEANEIARNGGVPDMQQLMDKYRQRDYSGLTGVTGIQGDIAVIEAEAQRIVDEFEQRHGQLCNELWDAIRKATQWSLRKSYQSGMMSAATFDHFRNMFQYYVPLRGWSETTAEDVYSYMMGEHGAFNGVLKKAEGRTSVADDPLATIGNMAESSLIQGNRNLLKQHLLRMAQNHPTDVCQVRDVWLVEGPGGVWEPHWPNIPDDATPDEIDQILQDHEADMQQLEASGQAKRVRNNLDIPYRIDPKHVPEHAVVAKVAGVDHVIYINGNPRAAQAINGQTGAPRVRKNDGFMRLVNFVFGDMKRFYSSVLTSLNINFSGANFVRDLPHAYAMTFMKQGPLKAAEYIAKSFQVIPWVFKNQLGKTGTSQMDRYFQEFLSSGAVTGYAHINDVDAWKANNKRRFARLSALGKAKVAVPRALGEVINAIGWFSETLELIPRFTAFLVERQAGKDIATATKAAKDITTNFNKKGSEVTPGVWGAVANTLRYMKMFFNPIVQGMYQFVDVASMGKENKWVGPRMVLATMHLPVLGAIVPYLNQFLLEALGGDDDDDYWLINEYTRRNNVCIFTGNGYVKIPIAPVFREMYGLGEVVATRHAGKADNEKTVIDLIDQLRTMGSVEGQSSYNEWSLARFLLPEHFAPLIDVMNNENFTGGPIYYDNNYKKYAPEYTKAKKSTWSPLVAASKWLNEMMGGDEDIAAGNSGKWMNPAVWQHLITNVGGGFAQLAGDVVSGITDIAEGKEIDASNMPVLKRFYSNSSDERAQWARFGIYKDFEKDYTLAKEKYQALDKRGLSLTERADEMVKFAESHPRAAAIYAVWEGGIKGADIPARLEKLGKDDPAYWDLVKEAVGKAEKAMNSGYVRAWEQKRKDRPDSMSDKELNERFDKSDNDSIRHIMADEISKRAGSQDYYGRDAQATWSDKSVAAWEAYQDKRTSDDIKADAELSNLLKVDDDEKDKARIKMLGYIKDELNKIRRGKDATSRSAGVKGLGEGDDERIMEELRAARKQLIEDLKSGSAEQAYRNLERRTMRLGLRKKAKEL